MGQIRNATKEKVDRVACILVKMERGEWVFADKKPRWATGPNGNKVPRVIKAEAVREVWGQTSNGTVFDLFNEKGKWRSLLEERIAFHRQRLERGYQQALAALTNDGNALKVMSDKLYESLWSDLNDPRRVGQIPFRERAKLFETLVKMEASIKGDVATQAKERLKPSVIVQQINVPDSVRQKMLSNTNMITLDSDVVEGEVDSAE
jgi:hypothetical protein